LGLKHKISTQASRGFSAAAELRVID